MSYFTDKFDDQVVSLLRDGAIGFLPTDTIYGLSASALNPEAVIRVYKLKGRDYNKPFIILAANKKQATDLGIAEKDLNFGLKFWPANLTIIFPLMDNRRVYLHRGTDSLAIRIPASQLLRELLGQTGPLISTSANMSGQPQADSAKQAKAMFDEQLDFYVDTGPLKGLSSTIARFDHQQLTVVRQGSYHIS